MFVTANGISVHYTISGHSGSGTILLVHGWGGTGRSLSPLADLLSKKYRVILVDLPGFGSSDNPPPGWGVPEYACVLKELLMKKAVGPVVYVGHSFGGALGIYLAAKEAGLISELVAIAASYHRTPPRKNRFSTAVNKLPLPRLGKLFLRKMLYKLLYPQSDILSYPHLEQNYRNVVATDLTPLLAEVKQPTLILWGGLDHDTPVTDAHLLKKSIKTATLIIKPDATHGLPLKEPGWVYREINKFI